VHGGIGEAVEFGIGFEFREKVMEFTEQILALTSAIDDIVGSLLIMNDAPGEPQITLAYSDASADQGYFVYRSFNTTNTGTNLTLRAFYDFPVGTGAAAKYFPAGAQWDNLAITRAADFVAPAPIGSGSNSLPIVAITSPPDGTNILSPGAPVTLQLTASASDYDGSVTNVAYYAGATWLGQVSISPYTLPWTIPTSGSYQLTAVATDNQGATTVSAPVGISATVPASPPLPALRIFPAGTNFALYWPTSYTAASLQWAASLISPAWQTVTNVPAIVSNQFTVTLPNTAAQRYFTLGPTVDPSTMTGKLLMGYQGWFACPGDGSAYNRWVHWFGNNTPDADNAHFDFWPDTSELDADELFSTSMTYSNGTPAKLYSAYKQKTVVRHFKWMQDNHLDGVFFQRFLSDLPGGNLSALRNQVAVNVRVGAETYGRVFAIMYDISGYTNTLLVSKLTNDWLYLVNTQKVTNSSAYLHHNGKPVVAIWGFGFKDRYDTPQQAQQTIDWFKAAGCTVMGGLPTNWRTLTGDAQTNAAWSSTFRSFDVISPWSVGRYSSNSGADSFRNNYIVPDLADCTSHGIDYLPVIFPGFSWTNLNGGPFNQIPRNGGNFYWRQAYNAVLSGCTMIYGAMFDEVDEGTAMYKCVPTAAQLPAQGTFVPLNIDGYNLGSDWYLRLADQAGKMLRGEIPVTSTIPITPP
ncbi:MAG: Ig-like domain-containing protein, partial [Verrucomicrobia bacterium]|nr:Ig-like domain-containing protein [Verrucomicrobiota bacterium]